MTKSLMQMGLGKDLKILLRFAMTLVACVGLLSPSVNHAKLKTLGKDTWQPTQLHGKKPGSVLLLALPMCQRKKSLFS